jgi:hypothetical protein
MYENKKGNYLVLKYLKNLILHLLLNYNDYNNYNQLLIRCLVNYVYIRVY